MRFSGQVFCDLRSCILQGVTKLSSYFVIYFIRIYVLYHMSVYVSNKNVKISLALFLLFGGRYQHWRLLDFLLCCHLTVDLDFFS